MIFDLNFSLIALAHLGKTRKLFGVSVCGDFNEYLQWFVNHLKSYPLNKLPKLTSLWSCLSNCVEVFGLHTSLAVPAFFCKNSICMSAGAYALLMLLFTLLFETFSMFHPLTLRSCNVRTPVILSYFILRFDLP